MESNLRPRTLGEILDRTAELYRSNFLLFAGIFAIYAGVGLAMNLLVIGLGELLRALHLAASLAWVTLAAGAIELLVIFLLFGAAVAAISRAVAWVHLGEPATIRGAYRSILPRLPRYLWLMAITALVVWTPFALLYGGYFGALAYYGIKGAGSQASTANPQATVILVVASLVFIVLLIPVVVYTVLMGLRYSLALPACVVEDLKARPSLRRSILLSKGSRGRILALGLLIGVLKLGVVGLTQFFVLAAAFKHHGQIGPGMSMLSQVITFFTNSFLGPIYATGITLFYYDQRVRQEGYDIEWMMQAAGLTPTAPVAELPAPDETLPASMPALDPPIIPPDPGSVHE